MFEAAFILLTALFMDLILGDPLLQWHPVRLIGRAAAFFEKRLYAAAPTHFGGLLLWLFTIGTVLLSYSLLLAFVPHFLFCTVLLFFCIAQEDLIRHVRAVQLPLARQDIPQAKHHLQHIVGREVESLSRPGIARAAIESLAESFVDGILSPLFWYLVGALLSSAETGVLLALLFKATSTLDSMVGYTNQRYRLFGTVSARMDDLLNFIPARLSLFLITAAAQLTGHSAAAAWKIGCRDRWNHASPNSAHAEAATAGALGLKLGGPTRYPHGITQKPWLGDGTPHATPEHMEHAIRLIQVAALMAFAIALLILFTMGFNTTETTP